MIVNDKYAHTIDLNQFSLNILIRNDINIKEILGAPGTKNVDRNYDLPIINVILFEFLQWLKDNTSINTF